MLQFKKSKVLSVLILSMLSLFSCGKTETSLESDYCDPTYNPFGRYEETVHVKGVMEYLAHNDSRVPSNITPDNQKFMTFLKDKLNVQFEYMWKVNSSQYENKLSGTILSRKYPDILKVTASQYANFKAEGLLKDLTETYKYASPEVEKYLYRDPEVIESLKDEDGKIYAIPQYDDPLRDIPVMYFRKDWLNELGLSVPTTPAELKVVLKRFKDEKGATSPLAMSKSYKGSYFTIERYMQMFGSNPYTWVDNGSGDLVASEVTDSTKNALSYFADLYKDGLLAPDFASKEASGVESDVKNGKTGVIMGPWWQYEYPIADLLPTQDWGAASLPLAEGAKVIMPKQSVQFYYVAMKTFKHPEVLMKMINMYIELDGKEGAKAEDGYVWSWVPTQFYDPYDINTQFEDFQEQIKVDPKAENPAPDTWTSHAKKLWSAYPDYLTWKDDHGAVKFQANNFANIIGRLNSDGAWAAIRNTKASNRYVFNEFYGLPTEGQTLYGGQMSTHCETYFTKVILGENDLNSTWNSFKDKWFESGGTQVTGEVNAWYDAK